MWSSFWRAILEYVVVDFVCQLGEAVTPSCSAKHQSRCSREGVFLGVINMKSVVWVKPITLHSWASSNQLKGLQAQTEVSRRVNSQHSNTETLPEFAGCCPVEFRLRTAISTGLQPASLHRFQRLQPHTILWAYLLNLSLSLFVCFSGERWPIQISYGQMLLNKSV